MKRIAIFADGTWDSPIDGPPTNVLRMARAIRPVATKAGVETEQIAFYDWGVGSDRKKLTGGISGSGIDKNIMDCYRFIVHNYNPGDELFFFGFSRGAYTVRSLAGFIRNCGILKRQHASRIPDAYKLYRNRRKDSHPDADKSKQFRRDYAVRMLSDIKFVGAMDTVGSLGIPVPFWGTLNEREFLFHDTSPSRIIKHARHAVAIDENREDFDATLWDEKDGVDLKQVWFAGHHGNVGGGLDDTGLSDCAADWILKEAEEQDLKFESHFRNSVDPRPDDRQHDGRKHIYRMRKKIVRNIAGPVHQTVKERWDSDAHRYRKKSQALNDLLASVDNDWSRIDVVS